MQEVDINTLIYNYYELNENIPNDIIIVGEIEYIDINYKYDKLDLSKVECNEIFYYNQEGESIKNHMLPNSLQHLFCFDNEITFLPEILPNSLKELNCINNQLTSLPKLPNSLKILNCSHNKLTYLPDLPNSLRKLYCSENQLASLPIFENEMVLVFNQDKPIEYIPYTKNIELFDGVGNKINIKDYPHNPITNQDELDNYMDYQLKFLQNRVKSARN